MKKNYITLFMLFLFVAAVSAQTTTIDFSNTSYDSATNAGVDTNLNNHPDWNSDGAWGSDFANAQIKVGSNWKRAAYKTPIKASVGEVLTAKLLIKLGNNDQAFKDAESFLLIAFQATDASSGASSVSTREGVIIKSSDAAGNEVSIGSQGKSSFGTNPSITQENKSTYEVVFEIEVGADAASSKIKARIRNVGTTPASSPTQIATGINDVIYDAIVGNGAYLLLYTYSPFAGTNNTDYFINQIYINNIELTVTSAGVLATENFNNFEFSMSPNPVNDVLTINTKETLQKVEIFNLLGKKVLSSTKNSVDVSSLSTSVYLVKISSDKGISTKKLIKN